MTEADNGRRKENSGHKSEEECDAESLPKLYPEALLRLRFGIVWFDILGFARRHLLLHVFTLR